ncbi:MAG: hypothetical protein LBL84_00400 [Candidatus Nomurabacteria bacterium]|jgi:hypothetical protein|nr:hypothetical protein [Candidatus Nomurabacteria bacterium]
MLIKDLDIQERAKEWFKENGAIALSDFQSWDEEMLLLAPRVGQKTVEYIKTVMAKEGLVLKSDTWLKQVEDDLQGLSTRTKLLLYRAGINTVEQLMGLSALELTRAVWQCGPGAIAEIETLYGPLPEYELEPMKPFHWEAHHVDGMAHRRHGPEFAEMYKEFYRQIALVGYNKAGETMGVTSERAKQKFLRDVHSYVKEMTPGMGVQSKTPRYVYNIKGLKEVLRQIPPPS